MDKDSVLYLLMDMRVNGILDRILEKDEEYQEIARKSGEYLDRLEAMELPQEARSLIDLHSCEQNALGARYTLKLHGIQRMAMVAFLPCKVVLQPPVLNDDGTDGFLHLNL